MKGLEVELWPGQWTSCSCDTAEDLLRHLQQDGYAHRKVKAPPVCKECGRPLP